ncbi:MAG: NAD(P)H-binding protein [Kofleriaceae bacterium]
MTIAVAGGSGRLGTLLVQRLLARGEHVRVLTRDPERAKHLSGVEICVGDVRRRDTLTAFVMGASVVVSAVHGFVGTGGVSPATVDRDGNLHLIAAAVAAGAEVVLVSGEAAAPDHAMEMMRMKFAAEQALKASGTRWTIVRATAFLETWIGVMTQTANTTRGPLVFGRGTNPINFVSVHDVAELVVRVALDPSTRGATFDIGGPEDLTLGELAEAVARAKQLLPPKHIPRAGLRMAAILTTLFKPAFARQCRAALELDRMDARFHATSCRERFPGLPLTRLSDVLAPR